MEHSQDVGEFSEMSRKRIIEMLNTVTMDIYFINTPAGSGENATEAVTAGVQETYIEEQQNEPAIIPASEPAVTEVYESPTEETPAEETPIENIQENIFDNSQYIPEEDIESSRKEAARQEPANEQPQPVSESNTIVLEDLITETKPEEQIQEIPVVQQQFVQTQPVQQPVVEISEKPLTEQETEEAINAKNELETLKNQLSEERHRLEMELQNWQEEKRKKEEEMLATKKLLEALQQQAQLQQQQQQSVQPQTQQFAQPQVQAQPQIQQQPQFVQPQQQFVQPQPQPQIQQPQVQQQQFSQPQNTQPVQPNFQREPVNQVPQEKSQETLIDSYLGSKKVLGENFEKNEVVNQISTPISSLSKAIGINDRFRFIKELFGGDFDLYTETIEKLDKAGTLAAAVSYIESKFSWNKNNDSVKQFISLIRRRYIV